MNTINDMLTNRFKEVQAVASQIAHEDPTFEWVEETHFSKVDGK